MDANGKKVRDENISHPCTRSFLFQFPEFLLAQYFLTAAEKFEQKEKDTRQESPRLRLFQRRRPRRRLLTRSR